MTRASNVVLILEHLILVRYALRYDKCVDDVGVGSCDM
jgi:hypothetical protein